MIIPNSRQSKQIIILRTDYVVNSTDGKRQIRFNFCRPLVNQCNNKDENITNQLAALYRNVDDLTDCYSLTDSFSPAKEATSFNIFNATDSKGNIVNYLEIMWARTNAATCPNASITFEMLCDKQSTETTSVWTN